jgi:L-lactate utilization protein LutC
MVTAIHGHCKVGNMSEVPLDEAPREVTDAAHDAARGQVVYLTEHGHRLAAIVPAEVAAEMESMSPEAFRELLEEFADAEAVRESLAEGGEPVPWERVKAEAEAGVWREAEAEDEADFEAGQ